MNESIKMYFNVFRNYSEEGSNRKISYLELLGISWSLHMLYAIYSIFTLYLGVQTYSYFSGSKDFTYLILEAFSFKFQKLVLISTLFGVVLYPFIFQFAYKFWKATFKFYSNIFDYNDEQFEEKSEEILTSAFTSNLFLLFPIIGRVLSNITLVFFLFVGMKKNFEFTSLQAILVLATPLFLLFLISVLSASYFVFLFTLL